MMKLDGGYIFVKATKEEESVIKAWRLMTKDRQKGWWYGRVSLELLSKLQQNGGLIPDAKKEMMRLARIRNAVDAERIRPAESLKPLYKYPVKPKLYAHQTRAANMALMVFEMTEAVT